MRSSRKQIRIVIPHKRYNHSRDTSDPRYLSKTMAAVTPEQLQVLSYLTEPDGQYEVVDGRIVEKSTGAYENIHGPDPSAGAGRWAGWRQRSATLESVSARPFRQVRSNGLTRHVECACMRAASSVILRFIRSETARRAAKLIFSPRCWRLCAGRRMIA
jgi:hypothetical protein